MAQVDRDSVVYPSWWLDSTNVEITTLEDGAHPAVAATTELLPEGVSFQYTEGGDDGQWVLIPWVNIRRVESSIS